MPRMLGFSWLASASSNPDALASTRSVATLSCISIETPSFVGVIFLIARSACSGISSSGFKEPSRFTISVMLLVATINNSAATTSLFW